MPDAAKALDPARANLRQALANDGIRRLGITWMLGIAADSALVVVTLVTVFNRGGVVAAALLGAVRMVPAVDRRHALRGRCSSASAVTGSSWLSV